MDEFEQKVAEQHESLATELLKELKVQTKRWFWAFVVTLALLFASNMAWLYVFQSYDYVSQDGAGYNYFNSRVGGDVCNGTESESEAQGENAGN